MKLLKIIKTLHLYGVYKIIILFFINRIFIGMKRIPCAIKRVLLRLLGFHIGSGTKIVGPIYPNGNISIGKNCFIGKNLSIEGNGTVIIDNYCDLAPNISFATGGHDIGNHSRRAGNGQTYKIFIGKGVWIGTRATILGNVFIGDGSVVAACACVVKDVPNDVLVGGVPAKIIKKLNNDN